MEEMIQKTVNFLKSKIPFVPKAGIILGTGLNGLADQVENPIAISYEDIPGFVVSTAPSHQGKLIAGQISSVPVIVFQGRFHYYEGWNMEQVTYPVRVLKALGVDTLMVTNASGSLNPQFTPGSLILLSDHINMMGINPLIGKNRDEFGERFPSMNEPYNKTLSGFAKEIAEQNGISLREGVYCAVTGPSLETSAECKMFASFGADLVGMSTVPEVIVAVHCRMKVLAISVVTNLSNIFHSEAHSQEEIRENAQKASANLQLIIKQTLKKMDKEGD